MRNGVTSMAVGPRAKIDWRAARRRHPAGVQWQYAFTQELTVGSYVKIQVGPHEGLYGWVLESRFDGARWNVAVSDKPPKMGGLYQWFRVADVWLASLDDAAEDEKRGEFHR